MGNIFTSDNNLSYISTDKIEFNLRDIPITIYDEQEALENLF